MEKLEIWNAVKRVPPENLREIRGGRLSGKTDISPQWRYKAMTEQFGPCGIGWKYTIDRLWREDCSDGQVFAFAQISLFVKNGDSWSDAIPGQGGSMLIEKEMKGPYSSDEGYKMAITDALSVAMKLLGVAADIYMGIWDGSKYRDQSPDLTLYMVKLMDATAATLKPIFTEMAKDFSNDKASLEQLTKLKDLKKAQLGIA